MESFDSITGLQDELLLNYIYYDKQKPLRNVIPIAITTDPYEGRTYVKYEDQEKRKKDPMYTMNMEINKFKHRFLREKF